MHRTARLTLMLAGVLGLAVDYAAAKDESAALGRKIAEFNCKDYHGKSHALADYADRKLVVVVFLGTECPLAKLYGARLAQLSDEFAAEGVAFLGIDSNRQDSITEIAAYARNHGIEFPILKDLGNELSDKLGATRTPQVFVLDQERVVRYEGRIDGQYSFGAGVGYAQPKLGRRDLAEALTELLSGKEVSLASTEVKGCLIGRVREPANDAPVTYSNQIARIFQNRCVECHREGQIAPFAMTSYEEVAGWGEMIAEVVREQRMPPWHADASYGVFSNEARLSDEEKNQVYAWAENGCPEGDKANLPEPRQFAEGWMLPREPDQVVYIADEPVNVKAEGVEDYRHYVVDPGFTEGKWVKLAECMPGNRKVVHHIIVFVKPPGQGAQRRRGGDRDISGFGFLAGFAPGTRPMVAPEGMAKKVPAGSQLVFQMHYTPCGTAQTDRSGVGLIFVDDSEVTHQLSTTNTANHVLEIPPNEPNHTVTSTKKFARDTMLLSMFPHMHIRGKSFRYEVTYPDGKHEILLDVPRYDFNWQNSFILAEPKVLPKGTELLCTAVYDNSADNLYNPDPSKTIRWGPQTWDEMMIGWYDVAFPKGEVGVLVEQNAASEGEESGGN